jgi:hypothetical protein
MTEYESGFWDGFTAGQEDAKKEMAFTLLFRR